MEGSSHFNVPKPETDAASFLPNEKLPEHLMEYQQIGKELRANMTPVMKAVLELMDKATLRPAALPETD